MNTDIQGTVEHVLTITPQQVDERCTNKYNDLWSVWVAPLGDVCYGRILFSLFFCIYMDLFGEDISG